MKQLNVLILIIAFHTTYSEIKAQVFELDNTYGNSGSIPTYIDCGSSYLLSNNKLLVASGLTADFGLPLPTIGVKKYNDDGTIDSTFGMNGTGLFTPANINDRFDVYGITVQSDGKIIVTGQTYAIGGFAYYYNFFLFRYNANGSTDSSFGINGLVKYSINTGNQLREKFNDVIIDNDGKILVVGYTEADADSKKNAVAMRFLSDGTIDSTFADNGLLQLIIPDSDYFLKVKLLSDNSIIIGGSKTTSLNNLDMIMIKLEGINGTYDSTFGTNGVLSIDYFGTNDLINNFFIRSDTKIMIAGSCPSGMIFTQIDETGNLDSSFSDDGKNVTNVIVPDHDPAFIDNILVMPDNKYLIFSTTKININSSNNYDYVVVRINENTTLDPSFAMNGVFLNVTSSISEYANSMHIQSDGKVLLLSQSWDNSIVYTGTVYRYLNAFTLSVNETGLTDLDFKIYPNPIVDYFEIRSDNEINQIEIYNMEGKKVMSDFSGCRIINFQNFQSGMYILKIYFDDHVVCDKFLKR